MPAAPIRNCPGICSAKRRVASKNPCEGLKPSQESEAAPRRHCAQGTTPWVRDTTPCVQDTANKYKEERLIEGVWRTIEEALKLEMTESNYGTYIADTRAISFDRDTGTLLVEAPSPLVANQLNRYFAMTVRRAIVTADATINGVAVAAVDFVSRRQKMWLAPFAPALTCTSPLPDLGRTTRRTR